METENEIQKKALELFSEYTQTLKGEFRDYEIFWLARERSKVIAARLKTLGFEIRIEQRSHKKKIALLREGLEVEEIGYTLKLMPNSAENDSYISISHPTAKIHTGIMPLPPEEPITDELNEQDLQWFQENKFKPWAKPGVKTADQKGWHFTPDQRHALLTALDRHWNQLEINAREVKILIGRRDTWKRIIEQAIEMRPSLDGSDRYVLCFLIQCELKYLRIVREIIRKNGGSVLNVCPDSNCSTEEHIKHIKTLENWLDQNLG